MKAPRSLSDLVQIVRERRSRCVYGVKTADKYLREINACLRQNGHCPLKTFNESSPERWSDMLKEARDKLVYAGRDTLVDTKTVKRRSSVESDSPALMTFEAVVTTSRKDRDGDVLDTRGARIDPNMPLLWQHITIQPIGRYVRTTLHKDNLLKAKFDIADLPLGRDAAVLVEMGALRLSHGFIPDMDEIDVLEDGGFYFGAFDIYEASLVSVPSNVDAVITAYSRKQLKTDAFRRWAKRYYDRRKKVFAARKVKEKAMADAQKDNGKSNAPATPCSCQRKMLTLPMVPGIEGSWEWTRGHLEASIHNHVKESGVLPDHGWCDLIATWSNRALVGVYGPSRPWVEDEVYRVRWVYNEETNMPEWVGVPEAVDVSVAIRERAIDRAMQRGYFKGYLRRARTPVFSGTEETPWSKPTLADYRAGLDLPRDANWEDLTRAQRQRIVEHTLIGDASADTFAEANAFPVVNPRTGKLNANALRNAIARAPQANIPEETANSIQAVARRLLDQNFREERSYDVLEKDLYFAATRESWQKLARTSDNLSLLADAMRRDAERQELERVLFE